MTKNTVSGLTRLLLSGLLLALPLAGAAQEQTAEPEAGAAVSVEELKRRVIELNRDLFILEEDLLFPASTQFAVFLSVDTGRFLTLDSVKLKVDDEVVAAHLYTDRQVAALQRGGMQRLYIGNLRSGSHQVTVFVEGVGADQRAYKKAATLDFDKGADIASLEIRVQDSAADYQPHVEIVEWE